MFASCSLIPLSPQQGGTRSLIFVYHCFAFFFSFSLSYMYVSVNKMVSFVCVYCAVCIYFVATCLCNLHSIFKIHPCCCKNLTFTHCFWFTMLYHVNTDIWVVPKTYITMSGAARVSLVSPNRNLGSQNMRSSKVGVLINPHQQQIRFPSHLYLPQHLVLSDILIFANLSICKVISHSSLRIGIRLNIFLCLTTTLDNFTVTCLFVFCPFCRRFLYVLNYNLL